MSIVRPLAVLAALAVLSACSTGSDEPVVGAGVTPTSSGSVAAAPSSSVGAVPGAKTTPDPAGETATGVATIRARDKTVPGKDVARSVGSRLTRIVGRKPDSVKCPDLAIERGAGIRCTLTDGSQTYGVVVVTTSVKGDDVAFDIRVDNQPR